MHLLPSFLPPRRSFSGKAKGAYGVGLDLEFGDNCSFSLFLFQIFSWVGEGL